VLLKSVQLHDEQLEEELQLPEEKLLPEERLQQEEQLKRKQLLHEEEQLKRKQLLHEEELLLDVQQHDDELQHEEDVKSSLNLFLFFFSIYNYIDF